MAVRCRGCSCQFHAILQGGKTGSDELGVLFVDPVENEWTGIDLSPPDADDSNGSRPVGPGRIVRFDDGPFSMTPLLPVGGDEYQALLPAASCDDTPEFFFTAEGSESGAAPGTAEAAA